MALRVLGVAGAVAAGILVAAGTVAAPGTVALSSVALSAAGLSAPTSSVSDLDAWGAPMAAWGGDAVAPAALAWANGPAGAPMAAWDFKGFAQEAQDTGPRGQVIRVAVSADAREAGAASVSMSYQLEVVEETAAVPFTLLLFAPATVEDISAQVGSEVVPVRLTDASPPRLEGEVELPGALTGSGQLSLDVGYRVADAVRADGDGVRVVLPMLAVDWAPAEASPGMFQAEVTLPEGMEAREIFPVTQSGGATPGVARASLQVLPAVVQVRARPEGSVGLSLPGVLELLVLIAVIVCGMAGLRYMRKLR